MKNVNYILDNENNNSIYNLDYENYIKNYTKNNIYMLNGLYNNSNIFNNHFSKYFTNTLELYKFITLNINKLDKIPNIDVNNFNVYNYPLCNNMSMFIDRHKKEDLIKFVIDIDIKYDDTHLNINKFKSLEEINFDELYKNIPKYIEDIIEEYFDYNIDNIDNEYIDYVLKYDDVQLKDNNLNQYNYIWANKINNNTNAHLYYPFIFVNQNQYKFIINKLVVKLNSIYKDFIWYYIIDYRMKSCGFRLLYCNKPYYVNCYDDNTKTNTLIDMKIPHKPNYYLINYDKTTIKLNNDDKIHHLFITSMQTKYKKETIILKNKYIDYFNNYKFYKPIENKNNKKSKNKINKINKIIKENKLNNIKNVNITPELDKVFNLLKINRLDDFDEWIYIIFICHTYDLYEYCIELSKKSSNYDELSIKKVNEIFLVNDFEEVHFNSLFHIIREDYKIDKTQEYDFLKDNNINIDLLNKELLNFNCNYQINNNYKNNIIIDDLIKLNIKDNIINNKNFNYLEVNNEFINDDDFDYIKNYNNICLISPVGTGKTATIKKLIQYWNNKYIEYYKQNNFNVNLNLNILCISSLISLGDKLCKDLNEFNIINYKDIKPYQYNNYDNLNISLEQLYLLSNNYDIIIIDEITSFISRFLSKTNIKISNNYYALLNLFKNCNHIIFCDALFCEDTYLLTSKLFNCNNNRSLFYYNKNNKCKDKIINNYLYDKNFNNLDNIISFINKFNINDNINNNESILICSDSAKISNLIYNYFIDNYKNKNDYFELITKDKYNKEFVNNCNETFNNKCVIYSPKITYGIDIQINYNEIFVIYKGKSINSYLMLQQISRSRKCKNINILSLFNNNKNNVLKFKYFKKQYINNIKNNNENAYNLINDKNIINNIDELFKLNDNLNNRYNDIIDFLNIIIYNKYNNYLTNNNKLHCLKLLSEFQGYTFNNYYIDNIIENNIDDIKYLEINNYDNIKILEEIKLDKNYELCNNELKIYLNELIKDKKNINRILHSRYLFIYDFNKIENIFKNNNEDIIKIINNNSNNLKYVYQILINLNKDLGINKFELLKEYNKDNLIKFIENNKENIEKLYISKMNSKIKNKLKNKSYDDLLKEINNDKMNKKFKCINGLYLFNQFILNCYKYIDNNLIISNKENFIINKNRYKNRLIFNNNYINNMKDIYNVIKNNDIIITFN